MRLLAVVSFGATNSVCNITYQKNSFSISEPSYWTPKEVEETVDRLIELLDLRSQSHSGLHNLKNEEWGLTIVKDFSLSDLDAFENRVIEELKRVEKPISKIGFIERNYFATKF